LGRPHFDNDRNNCLDCFYFIFSEETELTGRMDYSFGIHNPFQLLDISVLALPGLGYSGRTRCRLPFLPGLGCPRQTATPSGEPRPTGDGQSMSDILVATVTPQQISFC
jgi:hypothetical protein